MSLNPPTATWSIASPTSLSIQVTNTEGDTVRSLWRELPSPSGVVDTAGASRVGDGELILTALPPSAGSLLVTLYRDIGSGYSKPFAFPATLVTGDSLPAAIGRLWALSPGLLAACGPIFSQETPESLNGRKLSLPWTILQCERSQFDFSFESIYWETTVTEFTVYALGSQKVEDAIEAIHTHLDWQRLPFQTLTTSAVRVEPIDDGTTSTFARHRTGEIVWKGCLTFNITVQKEHPRWKPYLS